MGTTAAAASAPVSDRVLAWVGGDDPATLAPKLLAFRRYVLLHLCVESWFRYTVEMPHRYPDIVFALLFTFCLGFGWSRRSARSAGKICFIFVLAQIVWWFPNTANHLYLEGVIVLLLALFDPDDPEEASLALHGLRWLPVLVLFYSGLKKLLYGYYFDGTFFGQMISSDKRFAEFFKLLLGPEEHLRLVRLFYPGEIGSGPYRIDAPIGYLLSNVTWLGEMLLPLGLLVPRLRRVALVLCFLLLLGIELAAREVFFGALFTSLLLLFAPRDLNRRLFPLFLLFLLWMLLVSMGVAPRWGLS